MQDKVHKEKGNKSSKINYNLRSNMPVTMY